MHAIDACSSTHAHTHNYNIKRMKTMFISSNTNRGGRNKVYLFSYKLQKFRTVGTGKENQHVRMITTEQKK